MITLEEIKNKMKIVYFGTPDFASYILQYILEQGAEVVGVVTNPDKPAGRGHKLRPSAVKEVAMKYCPNVPILQPENLRDEGFHAELKALGADLFIVIAFRMLPREVWAMPRLGTFNLHASLLPQYRGAAPIQHAILNDEKETGVTTFLLNEGIDEGNILLQEKVAFKTIQGLEQGTLSPKPQPKVEGLRYATKIFKEDRLLSFQQESAHAIALRIRAMSPYPSAIATLGEEEIKVFKATPCPSLQGLQPGEYRVTKESVVVQCTEGAVELW